MERDLTRDFAPEHRSQMEEVPPMHSPPTGRSPERYIESGEQLDALVGMPSEASIRKESSVLIPEYRAMIAASPFVVLATNGPSGLDASPRGDRAGFVECADDGTILLPERPGNRRADSLRNLLGDPRLALLFLIPGIGETLRVTGRARISVEPTLLDRFAAEGKRPVCVLEISVDAVYFQCARAVLRANLWATPHPGIREQVPTPGAILAALSDGAIDGSRYDLELPGRQRKTLY